MCRKIFAALFFVLLVAVAFAAAAGIDMNQPPSVSFVMSAQSTVINMPVVFSAYGLDPEDDILTYYWEFGDGGTDMQQNTVHSYSIAGTYIINVIVTDSVGNSASASDEIFVANSANSPPSLSMVLSQTNSAGEATIVASAYGIDPEGEELAYNWDFGDATINSNVQTAVHTYTLPGTYIVTVTATDPEGNTASDSDVVHIGSMNLPPSAVLTADRLNGYAPLTVVFSGYGIDPEDSGVSYFWEFGDGKTSNIQNPVNIYDAPGVYMVTLFVTDDAGNTASDSESIAVLDNDLCPSVYIIAEPETGMPPLTVVFHALGSDPEGEQLTYYWEFGDGDSAMGRTVVHTFSYVNEFEVMVNAQDPHGNTVSAIKMITVGPTIDPTLNVPPVAMASGSPLSGSAPLTVSFTGIAEDIDGEIVSYYWDFDDGYTSTSQNPAHAYVQSGVYNVQFIVADDKGATSSDSLQINVGQGVENISAIELAEGWNLISLPVMPFDNDINSVLSGINYASIWRWNKASDSWESYLRGIGGEFSTIESQRGYWIYSNENQVLTVNGANAYSQALSQGWNLAGYGQETRTVQDSLSEININSVWRWNADRQEWQSYLDDVQAGDFNTLEPGKGYWIFAENSGTWTY